MEYNLSNYKEIRGTLVKKKSTIFGKHYLYISDGSNTVSVMIGKAAFHLYTVGMQLTVGYIAHKTVNIRTGIVENVD